MLTLVTTHSNNNVVTNIYTCDFAVALAGDSCYAQRRQLWDCKDVSVRVTAIVTAESGGWTHVHVTHTGGWEVYTDTGFAAAISAALGRNVQFTEQGMQEDKLASMELA